MPTLALFLHSTGAGPFQWADVAPEIVAGTTKVTPTHLGYPPNPPLARGTVCTTADEAQAVVAGLPAGDAIHVYAHSYGAVVALALLPHLGDRVRSLFLYEPVMFGALAHDGPDDPLIDPGATEDARTMLAHPTFVHDDAVGGTDPWLEMFVDYWNRPGSWARMPAHMQDYARRAGWKMYQEVRACFLDIQSFADVRFGDIPTTLAMGERSPRASRAMTEALHRRHPATTLVEIPKVGHMAPMTQPRSLHAVMAAARHRAG